MNTQELDGILKMLGGAGDLAGLVTDEVREKMAHANQQTNEERQAIARAWAHFADTPDGAKALNALFDKTLNRVVFFSETGMNAEQVAMHGVFREGQNAIADEIRCLIKEGQTGEPARKRAI